MSSIDHVPPHSLPTGKIPDSLIITLDTHIPHIDLLMQILQQSSLIHAVFLLSDEEAMSTLHVL